MEPEFARQYYESASSDHWWFRGRQAIVAGILHSKGITSGHFVDLGAGAESLLPDQLSITKVDMVTPESVIGCFVQASVEALPFADGSFDGAGLFDVLEHLDDPSACLAEVTRIVGPQGVVLITVPAYRWLWSDHDDLVGHRRRYTRRSLVNELESMGLRVSWMSGFYGFLIPPALIRRVHYCERAMAPPAPVINRVLSAVADLSVRRALKSPKRNGLSIAALAHVP